MKLLVCAVWVFTVISNSTAGHAGGCGDWVSRAEKAWVDAKFEESDRIIDQGLQKCPSEAELYWRKARNIYDRVESAPRDKRPFRGDRSKIYEEMVKLADTCISLAPENGMCWFWKGASMGERATTRSAFRAVTDVGDILHAFETAASLKSPYRAANGAVDGLGDAYNALGQFYRNVMDWKVVEKALGIKGDMGKSVDYQRKAVSRDPNRIAYNKELGVSLACYSFKKKDPGAMEEAKKYLAKVSQLPEIKYSDSVDKTHARILLRHPELACGYSRDNPEVVEEESFEKRAKK